MISPDAARVAAVEAMGRMDGPDRVALTLAFMALMHYYRRPEAERPKMPLEQVEYYALTKFSDLVVKIHREVVAAYESGCPGGVQ